MTGIVARRRHDAEAISRHMYLIPQAKDRKPWILRNLEPFSQWHTVFSKFILLTSLQNVSPTQYQLLKYMSVLRTFSFKQQQDVCLIWEWALKISCCLNIGHLWVTVLITICWLKKSQRRRKWCTTQLQV